MSDIQPETDALTPSPLGDYRGVRDIYPDVVVVTESANAFHIPAANTDEPAASCNPNADLERTPVEVAHALRANFTPCEMCFKSIVDYFAQHPDPPVGLHGDGTIKTPAPRTDADLGDGTTGRLGPPLTTATDEVLTASGRTTMHAPTENGALCGRDGDYRRVERRVVEPNHDFCRNCFDIE
jgi:hypothetical protein